MPGDGWYRTIAANMDCAILNPNVMAGSEGGHDVWNYEAEPCTKMSDINAGQAAATGAVASTYST